VHWRPFGVLGRRQIGTEATSGRDQDGGEGLAQSWQRRGESRLDGSL